MPAAWSRRSVFGCVSCTQLPWAHRVCECMSPGRTPYWRSTAIYEKWWSWIASSWSPLGCSCSNWTSALLTQRFVTYLTTSVTLYICFIIVVLLQLMQGWWYSQVSYCAVCQQKLVTYSVPVLGSCSRHMLSVIVWCENKFTAHISKMISWMNSLAQCYFFFDTCVQIISPIVLYC